MKRPSIPSISIIDQNLARILRPMKESIEVLGGVRGDEIKKLNFTVAPPGLLAKIADNDPNKALLIQVREQHQRLVDIANKINEIIDRLSP